MRKKKSKSYYEKAYEEYNDGNKIYLEEYYKIRENEKRSKPEKTTANKMDSFYIYKTNKTLVFQAAGFFLTVFVVLSGILLYSAAEKKAAAGYVEPVSDIFIGVKRDSNTLETIGFVEFAAPFDAGLEAYTANRQSAPRIFKKYNMKYIDQNKVNMPNGCEAVSLAMVLSRYLPDITAKEIADKYLPKSGLPVYRDGIYTAEDPAYYYIGDPAGTGFGIFAPGLVNAANAALEAYQMNLTAIDISGCTEEELLGYISDGYPVIVWVPMRLSAVNWGGIAAWHLPNWRLFRWPSPMHCAVLVDFTETRVTLYDPTVGVVSYDKELFFLRWGEMGPYPDDTNHAAVIK